MPKNTTESKKATNTDKITRVNSCRNQIALPLWPSKRPFPSLVPANPFVRGREVLHSDSPGHGTSCDHLVWQHSTHSQAMVLITAQFKQLPQISARCSQMEEFYILPFKLFLLEAYLWEHNEVKGELQSGWSFANPPCYFPHPRHPPSLLPSQDGILFHPYSLEENGPATTIKSQSFHSQFRYSHQKRMLPLFKGSLSTPSANRHKGKYRSNPTSGKPLDANSHCRGHQGWKHGPTWASYWKGLLWHTHFYQPHLTGLVVSRLLFYN